jgi:drug/metabolite transporter (DMT)-like permease
MLVTVVLAWGSTWPVNKVILASVPPLWSVTFRTAIATVALFAVVAAAGRLAIPPRGDVPVLLGIAILHMVGFTVLSTWGLQMVPTGRSVVLAYTTPLWVTPGARVFLGEPITARRAAGVAVGLSGLAVLFNPLTFDWTDRAVVLGNLAILAAAFLWAASILQIRAHRWRSTPLALAPWETLCAGLVLLPLACAVSPWPAIAWSPTLVMMLLFVGIPGTAIAYWAVAMASRDLPAVTTSLGLLGTPVVSVVTATLWLGEPLTWPLVAAVVLVLSGVAIGATALRAEPKAR